MEPHRAHALLVGVSLAACIVTAVVQAHPKLPAHFHKGDRVPWWLMLAYPNLSGWPQYTPAVFGTDATVTRDERSWRVHGDATGGCLVLIENARNVDIISGIFRGGVVWINTGDYWSATGIRIG